MNIVDHNNCHEVIDGLSKTIHSRLRMLDEEFEKARNDHENVDYFKECTNAMTNLVLDVIEHAVSYSYNVQELESFREKLQYADHSLSVAIDVLTRSDERHSDWQNEFEKWT